MKDTNTNDTSRNHSHTNVFSASQLENIHLLVNKQKDVATQDHLNQSKLDESNMNLNKLMYQITAIGSTSEMSKLSEISGKLSYLYSNLSYYSYHTAVILLPP